MTEYFKPVEGFEFYQVSNLGRVLSTKRKEPKYLKACPIKTGYLVVGLLKNNEQQTKSVHRLVAEAFLPNPEGLPEVIHLDSDKTNNTVKNLKWGTSAESIQNSINNGKREMPAGEAHYKTFLTSEQVKTIREFYNKQGVSEVYKAYPQINKKTLQGIITNKNWKEDEPK